MAELNSKKLITKESLAYFKEKMDTNMKAYVDGQIKNVTGFEFKEVTDEEIDEMFHADSESGNGQAE